MRKNKNEEQLPKLSKLKLDSLLELKAKNEKQDAAMKEYDTGQNLILSGSAGTGKTFIGLGLAIEDVLDPNTDYNRLLIIRSAVPTRDMGFLPGDEEEKKEVYSRPYVSIMSELFNDRLAWQKLQAFNQLQFDTTSYTRGHTWNNCIVVIDEMQNLSFHELDSVISRMGDRSKIIFCGDYYQTDFVKSNEKDGLHNFMKIINRLESFTTVEFTWKDIVRSKLVRDYIVTKEMLIRDNEIFT